MEGPIGRVALVIADLEHWSKLWDTMSSSMNEVIRLYAMQLRQNMRKCRGKAAPRGRDFSFFFFPVLDGPAP